MRERNGTGGGRTPRAGRKANGVEILPNGVKPLSDAELLRLYAERSAALKESGAHHTPLCDMGPDELAVVLRARAAFRSADAVIAAELRRRDKPVRLGPITLHLTRDRLHFVTLDQHGRALYACRGAGYGSILYDYR